MLQKVARGDFHYWLPIDGVSGLFVSLLCRIMAKTIADFTGVIQFRGPQELGGLYLTFNLFLGAGQRWRWREEKPKWFTASWISKVPIDMIPEEGKKEAAALRASMRRGNHVPSVVVPVT